MYVPNIKTEHIFGDEVWRCYSVLLSKRLVKRRIFTQFDYIEYFYHHVFSQELKTNPFEHPIIIIETSFNPKASRKSI